MHLINSTRVQELLMGLAKFTATECGVTRLAYSDEHAAAEKWLLEQVMDLGLQVTRDAVGNIFLRREGLDHELAPVVMGSHIDTVVQGGAYDGCVGVVGALEVLYMLRDEQLQRSLEVIIFMAEESSRFGFATIGSKLMTGQGTPEQFSVATKKGEINFKEALLAWDCDPNLYQQAVKVPGCFKSFWELHIEQGKVLEEIGNSIGIVHNIAAPNRFKIIVTGMADHSGVTPMDYRKDALVSAAKLVLAIEKAAKAEKNNGTVATVGILEIEPASINVIPGKAILWVDLRGVDVKSIQRTREVIEQAIVEIADHDNIGINVEQLTCDVPVSLAEELTSLLEKICVTKEIAYLHMNSGAGHDAMHMAKLAPTSMIFIPCKGGISHNEEEYASIKDICLGINVMAEAVLAEAK